MPPQTTYRDPITGNIYDQAGQHIRSLAEYQTGVATGRYSGSPLAYSSAPFYQSNPYSSGNVILDGVDQSTGKKIVPGGASGTPPARTPRVLGYTPDTTIEDYYKRLNDNANIPVDEATIRKNALAAVQAQIDALSAAYDSQLADIRKQNEGRTGQTRAINSRRGVVGSEIGDANAAGTEKYNNSIIAAKEAEKAAAITAVMTGAQNRASDEIAKKVDQNKLDAANYIGHLTELQTTAKNELAKLASTGVDVKDLSDEQYKTLLKDGGFKSEAEFDAFFNANKPKAAQVKYEYKELKDGSLIRYGDDGSYKQIKDVQLPKEGDWQVKQLQDGTVIAYDQKKVNADGTFSYQNIGAFAKKTAGKGGGGSGTNKNTIKLTSGQKNILSQTFPAQDIADLETAINTLGKDKVRENITDPTELKAFDAAFGYNKPATDVTSDAYLKNLGFSAADISAYKSQTQSRSASIDPTTFLAERKKKKTSSSSSSSSSSDSFDSFLGQ